MAIPGILYSILAALAAWAIEYFATGNAGGDYLMAPIIIAVVPILLKMFTVGTSDDGPTAAARAIGEAPAQRSKMKKILWG